MNYKLYTHISDSGKSIWVATLPPTIMIGIQERVRGEWRPYKSKRERQTRAYHVTEDMKVLVPSPFGQVEIRLWAGDVIVECWAD